MGYYSYRRRRSGPNWTLVLALLLLLSAGVYFVPQYLYPRVATSDLGSAIPAVAATSSPLDAAASSLAEGDTQIADGRWAAAANAYAEALRVTPGLAQAEAGWALALTYANRPAEALEHARKAVEMAPDHAAGHAVLALAQDWSGAVDGAIDTARKAIALDPNLAEPHAYLAEALTDKYKLLDADDELQRAFALGGRDRPDFLRVQGYLRETRADYVGAVESYKRSVEKAPNWSFLYVSLGHGYRAQKRYADAQAAFQRAVDLNPQDARGEGGLGMVSYATEEYAAAQVHFERAIAVDPTYAAAHGQLGWVFYVQRLYDKAQPRFERAIELEKDPSRNAAYRHALGWIYLNTKQLDRARQQFTKALEQSPGLEGAKEGIQALDRLQGTGSR